MIRSGGWASAASSASWPSRAVTTSYPALRSFSETTCRMCVSSSATRIRLGSIRPLTLSFCELQLEAEATPLAHVALHQRFAAMHGLDDLLHERQPQARALGHAVVGLDAIEFFKDDRQV